MCGFVCHIPLAARRLFNIESLHFSSYFSFLEIIMFVMPRLPQERVYVFSASVLTPPPTVSRKTVGTQCRLCAFCLQELWDCLFRCRHKWAQCKSAQAVHFFGVNDGRVVVIIDVYRSQSSSYGRIILHFKI